MEKTRKIGWSRRQFMEASAAALAMSQLRTEAQLQPGASSAPLPPEVIAGSVRPLLEGTTARPMRYQARERGFAIANGSEFFNRPLYGPNNGFRVDAGDLPEFSLYLPGHAGNLRLGVSAHGRAKWLAEADRVEASYTAGRMVYEVRDALLGAGVVRVELLTAGVGAGLLVRAEATNVGAGVALSWAFGGVSGRKGRRSGDIGCEAEPVARFFRLRPEECAKNVFTFSGAEAHLASPFCASRMPRPGTGRWSQRKVRPVGQPNARSSSVGPRLKRTSLPCWPSRTLKKSHRSLAIWNMPSLHAVRSLSRLPMRCRRQARMRALMRPLPR